MRGWKGCIRVTEDRLSGYCFVILDDEGACGLAYGPAYERMPVNWMAVSVQLGGRSGGDTSWDRAWDEDLDDELTVLSVLKGGIVVTVDYKGLVRGEQDGQERVVILPCTEDVMGI